MVRVVSGLALMVRFHCVAEVDPVGVVVDDG